MSSQDFQNETHPEVIFLDMSQPLSGDEIEALFAGDRPMAGRDERPVAVILDVRQGHGTLLDDGGGKLRRNSDGQPRSVALWVLLGGSRLAEAITAALRHARSARMVSVLTLDEAQATIERELHQIPGHAMA